MRTFLLSLTLLAGAAPCARAAASCACGPAPSCTIFGICWCGCPWGEAAGATAAERGDGAARIREADALLRAKCSSAPPKGSVYPMSHLTGLLPRLQGAKKRSVACWASSERPRPKRLPLTPR